MVPPLVAGLREARSWAARGISGTRRKGRAQRSARSERTTYQRCANDSASCRLLFGVRNLQDLSGVNQIGVFHRVAIRFEDAFPLVGLAVKFLGDLRQTVSRYDRVGARRSWRSRR